MYLLIDEDREPQIIKEITNEIRLQVDANDGEVYRFSDVTKTFQQLVVDLDSCDEDEEDAEEIEGDFFLVGNDRWTDIKGPR